MYYLAIDTLLIALEFEQNDQIYNLIAEIYNVLGNKKLSDKILSSDSRVMEVKSLKDELSGIYRKNHWLKFNEKCLNSKKTRACSSAG